MPFKFCNPSKQQHISLMAPVSQKPRILVDLKKQGSSWEFELLSVFGKEVCRKLCTWTKAVHDTINKHNWLNKERLQRLCFRHISFPCPALPCPDPLGLQAYSCRNNNWRRTLFPITCTMTHWRAINHSNVTLKLTFVSDLHYHYPWIRHA